MNEIKNGLVSTVISSMIESNKEFDHFLLDFVIGTAFNFVKHENPTTQFLLSVVGELLVKSQIGFYETTDDIVIEQLTRLAVNKFLPL